MGRLRGQLDPRTAALTGAAMVAFAANSVLCRLALGARHIDAASFTAVRLISGAVMLAVIGRWIGRRSRGSSAGERPTGWRRWTPPVSLFLYAICFSFAYLTLSAGTGALILFGAVQVTMIAVGLAAGERPHAFEWSGLTIALGGLVFLVSPGLTAPPLAGAALMAVAGVSWGAYSLAGAGAQHPVAATSRNFLLAAPLAVAALVLLPGGSATPEGLLLAALSGALASGLGYVLWYAALRGLAATRAATVQLSVPVLTALAGVAFLAERISPRLALASVVVLGGVGLSILGRAPRPAARVAAAEDGVHPAE